MKRFLIFLALLPFPLMAQVQVAPMYSPKVQFLDTNGNPVAGGLVYFYQTGTTTPQDTWTDSTGSVKNANPVVLDAGGFASIWLGPYTYTVTLHDSSDALIWSVDGVVSPTGPAVHGLGTSKASETPKYLTVVNGSSSAYITNSVATSPSASFSQFEGTAMSGAGLGWYNTHTFCQTAPSIDVQSGACSYFEMDSYSTNSGGTANDNSTNQVALHINSSALSTTGNANPIGLGIDVASLYTGANTHHVGGIEVDGYAANPAGFFSQGAYAYGTLFSAILASPSTQDFTAAFVADSSATGKGFLFGSWVASTKSAGYAVLKGQTKPDTAFWASQAGTYGLLCGAGITSIPYSTNAGNAPVFADNPANCVAAGPSALTSGTSSKVRFISTSAGGAEQDWDIFHTSDKDLHFQYGAADKVTFDDAGNVHATNNLQVDGRTTSASYSTATNCSSSASPAVCGANVAGAVVIAAGVTTVAVNTTAVGADSQIFVTFDESLGTKLSVTCNSAGASEAATYFISARNAGNSFTIKTSVAPTTNPACLSYLVVN